MNRRAGSRKRTEAEPIAEEWGSLYWLANKQLTNSGLTLGRVIIKKGQANPRHCHDSCEEVLYLLQGMLKHSLGDETLVLEEGDTLIVPPGVMHNALNIGETDADMIVAYSSGQRDFRKEA
jgi:quercetin dioxygenase-like cupin family protein